jgi:transposase
MPYTAAVEVLGRGISWATPLSDPSLVKLQKSIAKHRARILATIEHNLSNGLIESTNTKIRLITAHIAWPRSPSVATAPPSRAGNDPRKGQESLKLAP